MRFLALLTLFGVLLCPLEVSALRPPCNRVIFNSRLRSDRDIEVRFARGLPELQSGTTTYSQYLSEYTSRTLAWLWYARLAQEMHMALHFTGYLLENYHAFDDPNETIEEISLRTVEFCERNLREEDLPRVNSRKTPQQQWFRYLISFFGTTRPNLTPSMLSDLSNVVAFQALSAQAMTKFYGNLADSLPLDIMLEFPSGRPSRVFRFNHAEALETAWRNFRQDWIVSDHDPRIFSIHGSPTITAPPPMMASPRATAILEFLDAYWIFTQRFDADSPDLHQDYFESMEGFSTEMEMLNPNSFRHP